MASFCFSLSFTTFFLKKMGHPRPLCVYFRSFSNKLQNKTVHFSGIRTRIYRVEGEHSDHYPKFGYDIGSWSDKARSLLWVNVFLAEPYVTELVKLLVIQRMT